MHVTVEFDALMKIVSTIQMKEIKLQPFTQKKERIYGHRSIFRHKMYVDTAVAYLYALLVNRMKKTKILSLFFSPLSMDFM
jgi:hypothetical protein